MLARSLLDPRHIHRRDVFARISRQRRQIPAGQFLAVPVRATVPAAADGGRAETHLITLVIAPDRAVLTAAGRMPRLGGRAADFPDPGLVFGRPRGSRRYRESGVRSAGTEPSATDDRGNRYELNLDGWSASDEDWSGTLEVSPVPAPGTRWLELTMSPDAPAIRVELAGASESDRAVTAPPPAGTPVDGIMDQASRGLLRRAASSHGDLRGEDRFSDVDDIVAALDASGALPPGCPGLRRLAALFQQLGIEVPPALTAVRPAGSLPEAWTSVLENRHRRDGPEGTAAVAAVLPELDGARVVLAGLRSGTDDAELHVLAWGWPDWAPHLRAHQEEPLTWWARDNAGRWHLAEMNGGSFGDGSAEFELRLIPPLHPEASALEVQLTGKSGQVAVTVPLDWQESP